TSLVGYGIDLVDGRNVGGRHLVGRARPFVLEMMPVKAARGEAKPGRRRAISILCAGFRATRSVSPTRAGRWQPLRRALSKQAVSPNIASQLGTSLAN